MPVKLRLYKDVRKKLIDLLDTNCGYVDEEPAEIVADRILKSGIVHVVPIGEWKHLNGDEWCCPNCGHVVFTEGSWEHPLERGMYFCENCGANLRKTDDK